MFQYTKVEMTEEGVFPLGLFFFYFLPGVCVFAGVRYPSRRGRVYLFSEKDLPTFRLTSG
jgi:hypothetical protein